MTMLKEGIATREWNQYLDFFRETDCDDVYFKEEYVKLYEDKTSKAESFFYKENDNILLFPYIKREFAEGYFDLETPYGYGGPVSNSNDPDFIKNAVRAFDIFARENSIFAGLIRFHPLLDNYKLFVSRYKLAFDRKTVAMDLGKPREAIWKDQIHSKHRNVIVKAQRLDLRYYADEEMAYLEDFKDIYAKAMARLNADSFYFFSDRYFDNIKKDLNKYAFLGLVFYKDTIIAADLFFKYARYGHYHLSGTLEDFKKYNPNNFLIYKTALYLKEQGVGIFHLGGGSSSDPKNSLYKFKKRFSRDDNSFYIGKLIFNEEKYREVCADWEKQFPEKKERYKNFVLKYRY